MKKLLALTLLSSSFGFSQIVTIIDKGVERKISIPSQNIKARYTQAQSDNRGVIIAFNDNIDINNFEQKHSIKLEKKLTIGYYIFKNNSNLNDIALISKIIKTEQNKIKSIRPNWALGMMPR